jgi:hypothetical protein
MFDEFDRCTSIRQLALRYRETKTSFPLKKARQRGTVSWEVPSAFVLRNLLKHPIYAGTYVYGRTSQRIEYVDGRLTKKREECPSPDQWRVCIHNNHEAYISWERFSANQDKIAKSRPRWTMQDNLGPIRDGLALLSGLLRCAHCGRKIHVAYKSKPQSAMYYCDGRIENEGKRRCLSFGSKLVDQAVGEKLCQAISPHSIGAARLAHERHNEQHRQAMEQRRLEVQAAQYEVDRAYEQYDLVDPKNRLVADTLEERLNQKLVELQAARERMNEHLAAEEPLSEHQRRILESLAGDFQTLWNHPCADPALKKRILRAAIFEIIVEHKPVHQRLELIIHWQGGVHTKVQVKKRVTPVGSKTDPSLLGTVGDLAGLGDAGIARVLNMKGITTARGHRWTKDRVLSFRRKHRIKATDAQDNEEYMTGAQVAEQLGISRHGVEGLIRVGALDNHQVTDFAPWRISRAQVESETVRNLVGILKRTGRLPPGGGCPDRQLSLSPENHTKVKKGAL